MDLISDLKVLGQVAIAMVLGGVIGAERELADKPAGLRTHMLVAGAAALLVLLGQILITSFSDRLGDQMMRPDPVRIVEAIVTGIAFLGAGTIIRHGTGHAVQGLTTAATLLFTAAVGVAVASHEIILAIGATALALLTLRSVHRMELWLLRRKEDGKK